MFSREEKRQNRIDFWDKLENELSSKRNPHGTKVNWMNYNTGFNDMYFRMEADEGAVRLCIDIQMNDEGIRELIYQQFEEFADILKEYFKDNLIWTKEFEHSNGCMVSRLSMEKDDVNILRKSDWDKMQLFLKINFVKLDQFWSEYAEVFKNLK